MNTEVQAPIAIVSITKNGNNLAEKVSQALGGADLFTLEKWRKNDFKAIEGGVSGFSNTLFAQYSRLIYIMATGVVVRSIAPLLTDKTKDPAVVVMDEQGHNVIALLSGHLGGANELAQKIASELGANPVITTASDVNHLPSVDMLAKAHHLVIDSMTDAKTVTAQLVNGEPVALIDPYHIVAETAPFSDDNLSKGAILVSNKAHIQTEKPTARLIVKNIVLGLGCRKGVDPKLMMQFIADTCKGLNIDMRAIKTIASASVKSEEEAIWKASEALNCAIKFYDVDTLKTVDHLFEGSTFVLGKIGVKSVSATSAYVAGAKKGRFLALKNIRQGITLSVFEKDV